MKKRNLQTLVSLAQILSSVAVLVSIFFLITEYKRSTVLNEKNVEDNVYNRVMEYNRLVIENPDLAQIITEANANPDSLSAPDRLRYLAYQHIFFDSWETLWVGYRNGLVEEATWKSWNAWFINRTKQMPPLALEGNIDNLSAEFLAVIHHDLGSK